MTAHLWRQSRCVGRHRKTEVVKARIDPDFADRVDLACLRTGEPLSEFIRKAVLDRVTRVERGGSQ